VHDLHKPTVDAMPSTFDQLLAQGYEFVTVTELIELDEQVSD
jgi:peptidoglycan/xylan/chitin deacetylase (PgdA/CDA1 family)